MSGRSGVGEGAGSVTATGREGEDGEGVGEGAATIDRPGHHATKAVDAAMVGKLPAAGKCVGEDGAIREHARVPEPEGVPGGPEVVLWELASQTHSTVSPGLIETMAGENLRSGSP